MSAAFEQKWVKNLQPNNVKTSATKMDLAEQVMADIARFKKESKADRLVMIWCGVDGGLHGGAAGACDAEDV